MQLPFLWILWCNTSESVVFRKILSIFVLLGRSMRRSRHTESVFTLSCKKMWQFSIEERTTYNTHFLFRLWMRMRWASAISISIQVWGIASFIFFGFATTFLQISEISSTLFFFYYRHAGAKWHYSVLLCSNKHCMKLLPVYSKVAIDRWVQMNWRMKSILVGCMCVKTALCFGAVRYMHGSTSIRICSLKMKTAALHWNNRNPDK